MKIEANTFCCLCFHKVGHEDFDLGVNSISYKVERARFVDYTLPVGPDGAVFVSKPPQRLSAITNIIGIFDTVSWICILLSLVLVTMALFIIIRNVYIIVSALF